MGYIRSEMNELIRIRKVLTNTLYFGTEGVRGLQEYVQRAGGREYIRVIAQDVITWLS